MRVLESPLKLLELFSPKIILSDYMSTGSGIMSSNFRPDWA